MTLNFTTNKASYQDDQFLQNDNDQEPGHRDNYLPKTSTINKLPSS